MNDTKHKPKMRDSGVPWIGRIPNGWRAVRNLGPFDERKTVNCPEEELLSVTIERGIIRQSEVTTKKGSSNEDESKYKPVERDDLAYNKMRMWQGAIGRSDYRGIISPACIILRPRDRRYSRYFHYLYRTRQLIEEVNRHGYGLCLDMNSLRYEHFKTMYSPVPPPEVMDRIRFINVARTVSADPRCDEQVANNPDGQNRRLAMEAMIKEAVRKERHRELELYRHYAKDEEFQQAFDASIMRILQQFPEMLQQAG